MDNNKLLILGRYLLRSKNLFFLIFPFFILFFSCSKENQSDTVNGREKVTFTVAGIAEDAVNISNKASLVSNTVAQEYAETFDAFGWELSSTDIGNHNTGIVGSAFQQEGIGLKAVMSNKAATAMLPGKKFRVLIYSYANNVLGNFVATKEITTGTGSPENDGELILIPNAKYKYFAYSFDNADPILEPSNKAAPTVQSKTDAPLLYSTGEFTLNGVDLNISIVFSHKVNKVEVVVDGRAITAQYFPVLQANVVNLKLTTEGFNLFSGLRTGGVVTENTPLNTVLTFEDLMAPTRSVQRSTNLFYTSSPQPLLEVKLTGLTVHTDADDELIIPANPSSHKTAIIPAFDNTLNAHIKRGRINLSFPELPPNQGVQWATGNLYYDASDINYPYKFASVKKTVPLGYTDDCNYYWNFNTELPRNMTGSSYSPTGDPCAKVYPGNVWKTPTIDDYIKLRNLTHTVSDAPNDGNAIEYTFPGDKKLYIHEARYVTAGGNGTGCTYSTYSNPESVRGYYWTSKDAGALFGRYSNFAAYTLGHKNFDELSTMGNGNGLSIRCIKNAAP